MQSFCRPGRGYRPLLCLVFLPGILAIGCAGPGPRLFPASPSRVDREPGGAAVQWYDTDRDGEPDYGEHLSKEGRITRIEYRRGSDEQTVDFASLPADGVRDLVLILDSVPYPLVEETRLRGSLQFFPRPTRTIAPFPVMTDPSLVDFFHQSPGIAIESDYYDGRRETSPYGIYLEAGISIWHAKVDYWLPHNAHASAYLDQMPWFDHELRRIQEGFEKSAGRTYIGYCVGTSALGALQGWEGHVAGLARVERFCHEMVYQSRGRARITLLSDHGHNNVGDSRRVPLADELRRLGYRVTDRLTSPKDVVAPEFAMVTCAALYTQAPGPIARDVLRIEGIELSAYPQAEEIVVLSRDGGARITRRGSAYRYVSASGDPLKLLPILGRLVAEGQVGADGFVDDDVLLAATADHLYPDVVDRLWRGFHELFQNKPDVLLSVQDGFHCGSAFQTRTVGKLKAVHGNLRPLSSSGFALTMAGELPPVLRMRQLSTELEKLGVHVLR